MELNDMIEGNSFGRPLRRDFRPMKSAHRITRPREMVRQSLGVDVGSLEGLRQSRVALADPFAGEPSDDRGSHLVVQHLERCRPVAVEEHVDQMLFSQPIERGHRDIDAETTSSVQFELLERTLTAGHQLEDLSGRLG